MHTYQICIYKYQIYKKKFIVFLVSLRVQQESKNFNINQAKILNGILKTRVCSHKLCQKCREKNGVFKLKVYFLFLTKSSKQKSENQIWIKCKDKLSVRIKYILTIQIN